ncbi:MAG: biotin/lipoyl-binding protein [Anaerolineae bacterium]|nr:MAG: biotin/lipoyl-binding protein [Anaerolineae bacterium]
MKQKHFKVFLDGTEFDVEVQAVDEHGLEVLVNGRTYKVEFEDLDEPHPAAPIPTFSPARPTAVAVAGPLRAPMPGDITQLLVKAGDDVTAGQELLVLEAMKMKNIIRSPRPGKVASIEVAAGQSVNHGDVLIRYEDPA